MSTIVRQIIDQVAVAAICGRDDQDMQGVIALVM